jgi:2-hydroxychromene-2-carboxylate isomerase
VSTLRPELAKLVDDLVLGTAPGEAIALDTLGEAIGTRAVAPPEIDAMIAAIEHRGRRVVTAEGGSGELHLKAVLDAARALRSELGRPPRAEEIAERAGLTRAEVQHALSLARVMQR